jgi:uncharacterized membrane protein AbrB (regulator of aidB expression)
MGRRKRSDISMSDNPWVYVVLGVLVLTAIYMIFKIIVVPLLFVMCFSFVGIVYGASKDDEDIRNLSGVIFIVSLISLLIVLSSINFFENHELGKTIINSGKSMMESAGNSS